METVSHKITISMQYLCMILLSFFLISPEGLANMMTIPYKIIYGYGQVVLFVMMMIVLFVIYHGSVEVDISIFPFWIFIFVSMFIAVINGFHIRLWFTTFFSLLLIIVVSSLCRNRIDELIIAYYSILEIWVYINLISMLLYPNGMYSDIGNSSNACWIFGYKSSFQYYILPAVTLGWVNYRYRKQKLRYFMLSIACMIQTVLSGNVMLLVGMIIFLLLVLSNLYKTVKYINIWVLYIIDIILNIVLVLATSWIFTSKYGIFMLGVLGKNATLSRRASILWPRILSYISDHPIVGNGYISTEERISMNGGYKALIHSHNQLLEVLFIGGIVLLVTYVFIHIMVGKSLFKSKELAVSNMFSVSIFVLYLMMTVEVFTRRVSIGIWLILILAAKVEDIDHLFRQREDCLLSATDL